MLTEVAADEQAGELVPDLVEFLDGTGTRIGEALGVRAEMVDLEAGVLEVCATAIRLKGKGTVLQLRPKTEAGWRIIALPRHVVELCRRRMALSWPHGDRKITVVTDAGETLQRPAGDVGLLFPGLFGGVRNPSNANRDIKEVLTRLDAEAFDWVTSHTFRKTVATRLDDAGLSARAIADHLGHANPSMTQDVYMGRNVAAAAAAAAAAEILAGARHKPGVNQAGSAEAAGQNASDQRLLGQWALADLCLTPVHRPTPLRHCCGSSRIELS